MDFWGSRWEKTLLTERRVSLKERAPIERLGQGKKVVEGGGEA